MQPITSSLKFHIFNRKKKKHHGFATKMLQRRTRRATLLPAGNVITHMKNTPTGKSRLQMNSVSSSIPCVSKRKNVEPSNLTWIYPFLLREQTHTNFAYQKFSR